MKRLLSLTLLALLIPIGMSAQGTLTINGINANDLGQNADLEKNVNFDAATNTLTLINLGSANAPFEASTDFVVSSLPDLKVKIAGENYIQLPTSKTCYAFKTESTSNKITFVTDNPESFLYIYGYPTGATPFSGDGIISYSNDLGGDVAASGGYYEIAVPATEYGITISTAQGGPINITKRNRLNIFDGVSFDGQNTLVLYNAILNSITVENNNLLPEEGLVVYLQGENTIANGTFLIESQSNTYIPLTFKTNPDSPGSLTYKERTCTLTVVNSAFYRFEPIAYKNGLVAKLDYTLDEFNAYNQANPNNPLTNQTVTISVPLTGSDLTPIVNEKVKDATKGGTSGDGLGEDIQDLGGTSVSPQPLSAVVNNIQYELNANDGYDLDGTSKVVQLNSQVTPVAGSEPGEGFKGMIFRVPAGSGSITITAKTSGQGVVNVQVGKEAPHQFTGLDDDYSPCAFNYAVQEATNVYIYNSAPEVAPSTSRHRAPGKKMPNTIGIKSVSVSAKTVASAPPPPMSPKTLTKEMVAAAKDGNHITINDADVNAIASDAFNGQSDITYVDLTKTSITGVEIATAKYGLGSATILMLPAGNTTAATTKNVVIGGVCDDLLLDDSKAFDIPADFTAVKVAQSRAYTAGKNSTVCLPYALDATQAKAVGTFYEPTDISSGKVTMTSVTKTEANVPYMLKAKGTTVSAEMVEVKKKPADEPLVGTESRFVGTYKAITLSHTATKQYYCFTTDGTFIHVETAAVNVKPFRAYIVLDAALGRSLDVDLGDGTTGIVDVRSKMDDGRSIYYDLQGRRVLYPKKGVYILNGKKVIIK